MKKKKRLIVSDCFPSGNKRETKGKPWFPKGKQSRALPKVLRSKTKVVLRTTLHDFDCRPLLGMVPKKQKVVQSFSFRKRRFLTLNIRNLGNG